MNWSRRSFTKLLIVAPLAGSVMLEGCSVLDAIATYVPIGIDAVDAILSLVDPAVMALVLPISALIKVAFADLAAAVDDYQAAPAADKATLLAKIQTLLGDIAKHFQDFLTQLGATPGLALITSLIKIILDTLAGFAGKLGPTVVAALPKQLSVRGRAVLTVEPIKPKWTAHGNKKRFIGSFNAALDAGGHSEQHIPRRK